MPDDQAVAPAPDAQEQYIQQMLRQLQSGPPQAATGARAQVEKPSSVTGLLGYALGGGASGAVPMSADESEAAGNRSLLNFGLNLLANSGYSTERKTIGQLIGGGIGAAQQSLGQSEALTAARGQAQQEYAQSQQEQKLARIKEAIPLLNLQQQIEQRKALQNMPSPFGAPSASIGTAGDVPFALNNPLNIRFAGQPGAVNTNGFAAWKTPEEGQAATDALFGKYAEGGINTLTGFISRWAPPSENDTAGYIKNVAAATGLDPTAKLDFRDPAVRAKVQAAMAVQEGNKNSRRPTAPEAPPATATTAPAQAPARPDTTQPDVAPTGNIMAGPGAPTGGTIPPSTAAATGNANAIMAGMVGAGADPTTLAPGGAPPAPPGSVPTQTAGLVVPPGVTPPPGVATAPAGPLPVTPDTVPPSFEEFQKQHPIVVPPDVQALFNAKPDADQLAVLSRQSKLAETAYNVAKATGNTAGMEKALGDYNTIMGQENTVRENAAKLGRDAQSTWVKDRIAQQHTEWQEALKTENARQDILTKHQQDLAKQAQQGDITAKQSLLADTLTRNGKVFDQLNKESVDSTGAASELQGLLALSQNVKNPSAWATIPIGNTTALNRLTQLGLIDKGEAGANQLLQSGISNVVARLRQGMSMGNLSDKDLAYIESMAPNMYEDQDTRNAVISYLYRAQQQKIRFNVEVSKEMSKPDMTMAQALDNAGKTLEEKVPIVPPVPADIWDHRKDKDPFWVEKRLEWARENNIRPGTMFRKPNGGLEVSKTPPEPGPSSGPSVL